MSSSADAAAPLRLAVLISGNGSNLQSIMDAAAGGGINARVAVVISNVADAFGLERARRAGIPAMVIEHRRRSRDAFEDALMNGIDRHGPGLVVLAGFMRILGAGFVRHYAGRMVNIHPSLLPLYPGLDTHARAIAAGDSQAGCTVHVVTEKLDDGPILARAVVPILPADTPETLAARVLAEEHRIYPKALAEHVRRLPAIGTGAASG